MNPSPETVWFALAQAKPAEKRIAILDTKCDGGVALRQRLEALLAAHKRPQSALTTDAPVVKASFKFDPAFVSDEAVGQTLGRYKLQERVGEGGCGVVYVAEQTEPVRWGVALEVIELNSVNNPVSNWRSA